MPYRRRYGVHRQGVLGTGDEEGDRPGLPLGPAMRQVGERTQAIHYFGDDLQRHSHEGLELAAQLELHPSNATKGSHVDLGRALLGRLVQDEPFNLDDRLGVVRDRTVEVRIEFYLTIRLL